MNKNNILTGSAVCVVIAALLGVYGNFGGAISIGLASIGLFYISTQLKE
jgi:hypothetical protein